ncbi:hypothetical protein CKO25_09350 [Thiocapsa imhoffii]|uniref:Sulfotransferase n=1 Tax=Thiocapsa imhoffii TaxID=382777 RepID=A0A9X0WHX1_9GAMM|nr:sulfotransferase [Thiocapsa imhoffii]MBK1644850.1 hypothetical protein [Thiocapsa imhoffii]
MNAPDRPRMIAGSGRSGTTWVLDVIATTFQLRPIFEPLHPTAIEETKPFAWRFLPPGITVPGIEDYFRRVFAGQVSTIWTDYRVHPRSIFPHPSDLNNLQALNRLGHDWLFALRQYRSYRTWRKRDETIVKCIRSNLLLSWLVKTFDAKIVLLVRHPGAVVESKLRLAGISWDPQVMLETYRKDPYLYLLRGGLYHKLLSEDLSAAQTLTLLWCIENQTPMSEALEFGYHTVHYENLVDDGAVCWNQLAEFFELSDPMWNNELLTRPSQQASSLWRHSREGIRSHDTWMDRLSQDALNDIDSILNETNEQAYVIEQAKPKAVILPLHDPESLSDSQSYHHITQFNSDY